MIEKRVVPSHYSLLDENGLAFSASRTDVLAPLPWTVACSCEGRALFAAALARRRGSWLSDGHLSELRARWPHEKYRSQVFTKPLSF